MSLPDPPWPGDVIRLTGHPEAGDGFFLPDADAVVLVVHLQAMRHIIRGERRLVPMSDGELEAGCDALLVRLGQPLPLESPLQGWAAKYEGE